MEPTAKRGVYLTRVMTPGLEHSQAEAHGIKGLLAGLEQRLPESFTITTRLFLTPGRSVGEACLDTPAIRVACQALFFITRKMDRP
jgi:hypothetical protein